MPSKTSSRVSRKKRASKPRKQTLEKRRANAEHHALLGSYLQHRRISANITSEAMAKHLGIHVSTLSRWESGERSIGLVDLLVIQRVFPIHDDIRHYLQYGKFPKNF